MLRPYINMSFEDGPHIICPNCKLRIDLKKRKDWESFSKQEFWDHFDARHPGASFA